MITDDLRHFILEALPSVWHMEAALLFHARPEHTLAAGDVGAALYLDGATAEAVLADLRDSQLLRVLPADDASPRFRYAPRDSTLARLVDQLAGAYASRLVELTTLIHEAGER